MAIEIAIDNNDNLPAAAPSAGSVVLAGPSGHPVRAYKCCDGAAWFVLVDVFSAALIKNTGNVRRRVKDPTMVRKVSAWVVNSVIPKASGYHLVDSLNEAGMRAMLGISKKPGSMALLAWMDSVALPAIRGDELPKRLAK